MAPRSCGEDGGAPPQGVALRAGRGLERVEHAFEPVFDAASRVLVLGTMPSPASRETGFYYGHPRNRFWPVMARLFDEPVPRGPAERRSFALRRRIALWDVLASCEIRGAADASIADPVPNDLRLVVDSAPIAAVFATGATAWRLYRRLCEEQVGLPAVKLPSTSPANASWSLERLVEAYRAVREAAEGDVRRGNH